MLNYVFLLYEIFVSDTTCTRVDSWHDREQPLSHNHDCMIYDIAGFTSTYMYAVSAFDHRVAPGLQKGK